MNSHAHLPAAADRPVVIELHGNIAVLTIDRPPANARGEAVRRRMMDAHQAVRDDMRVKGPVVACAISNVRHGEKAADGLQHSVRAGSRSFPALGGEWRLPTDRRRARS
jgi:hypothetical protein